MGGFYNPYDAMGRVTPSPTPEARRRQLEEDRINQIASEAEKRYILANENPEGQRKLQLQYEAPTRPDIALGETPPVDGLDVVREQAYTQTVPSATPGPWRGGYDSGNAGQPSPEEQQLEAIRQEAIRREVGRRTIREVDNGSGVPLYTNVGDINTGRVVVSPDSGAPSTGTYNPGAAMGSPEHLNYLRNSGQLPSYTADEEMLTRLREQAARRALAERQIEDPVYRERTLADVDARRYYQQRLAAQQAEQDVRQSVLGSKAQIDSEYQRDVADIQARVKAGTVTPDEAARALEALDTERLNDYARAGIAEGQKFGAIG